MSKELHKDGTVTITTPSQPAKKGHITITTGKQTMEDMSEDDFAHFLSAASFSSNALFELGGAEGTNIIIDDLGELKAHVITRTSDDGLQLQWDGKQADQQTLADAAGKIRDKCDYIDAQPSAGNEEQPAPQPASPQTPAPQQGTKEESDHKEEKDTPKKDKVRNYLLQKLDRIP